MKRIFLLVVIFSVGLFQLTLRAQEPGHELKHYVDAERYFKAGNLKKAITEYRLAVKTAEPNSSNLFKYHYQIGKCFFRLRDAERALAAAQESVKAKQDFVPAYLLLARIYGKTRKVTEMNTALESAFEHESNPARRVDYMLRVMKYYAKRQDWQTALVKIKQARDVAPKEPIVNYYFAKISNELGNYQDAKTGIKSIEPSLKTMQQKEYAKYYFELGFAHYHLKEFKEANTAFKGAEYGVFIGKIKQFKPEYFLSIATAYYKVHENDRSREYVDKALEVQQSYPYAHVMMAQLAKRENEDPSSMIENLKTAASHETNFVKKVQLYDKIAELQIDSRQYDACLKTLEESLKIKSDDPTAWFEKAIALYKMGRYDESTNTLNTILKKTSDRRAKANMHFLLGLSNKKNNKLEEAKRAFYVALQSSLRNAATLEIKEVEKALSNKPKGSPNLEE